MLLEAKASVADTDGRGTTPLMMAASTANLAAFDLIVDLVDGDVVEIVNPKSAHLRGWARVAPELTDQAIALGPRGIQIAGAHGGGAMELRRPWTHCMRRQPEDRKFHRRELRPPIQ